MKKYLLLSIALVGLASTACQNKIDASSQIDETKVAEAEQKASEAGKLPVIKFEEEEFDFGTINEGDKVEHVFKFTNTGESELYIIDVKPSCGCTVPDYTKTPVAPGNSGEIKLEFNSSGKPGEQNKSVTVKTNTAEGEYQLKFKASVTPKDKQE